MALKCFFGLLAAAVIACGGGGSAPAATPTTEVDASSLPAFTLNGCTPRSAELKGHGRCDPVNLVFPGVTVKEVTKALVEAGWTLEALGSTQVVLAAGGNQELAQAVQLVDSDGTSAAPQRFHIRLWQLPDGLTIGAVHHERAAIGHDIDRDWEAAELKVRDDLCSKDVVCEDGGVIEAQRQQQEGERWRGFRNDARPSIIRLVPGD